MRWDPFLEFHTYLAKTFPLVSVHSCVLSSTGVIELRLTQAVLGWVCDRHEKATLEKTNRLSLIYTLEGSQPDLKPLVLSESPDLRHLSS